MAPVGVSKIYELIRPMVNVKVDITTLEMTTDLNFLNTCMDVILGKIIKLDIKSEPIILIPMTTIREHNEAKMMLYFSVFIPTDLANFSSNVMANILLYDKVYNKMVVMNSTTLITMSLSVTDRMLPKR